MSAHHCKAMMGDKLVTVMMGWDRPLQGFFLVVEDPADPESDDYVYSNIDDPRLRRWHGLPPELDHFIAQLNTLGIEVPALMIEEVRADKRGNVGNRNVVYDEQGNIKVPESSLRQ